MLTTLLLPTAGAARVLGLDVRTQAAEVRKRIGFAFSGTRGVYGRLSGIQNLQYFAELYSLEPDVSRRRIPELLEVVGLTGRGDERVEAYSSGMVQRLHMARALLHDPDVLFLDEPTVGIDPVGARELRQTIRSLIALGKTILLTTHYMAEAEELCRRIAIIKQGRIVALDSPDALKRRISGDSVIEITPAAGQMDALRAVLSALDPSSELGTGHHSVVEVREGAAAGQLRIRTPEPSRVIALLSPYLNPQYVEGLEVRNQTLEDVYVAIISREEQRDPGQGNAT
jgi:ABC-2 type transport system ATP-binding protein